MALFPLFPPRAVFSDPPMSAVNSSCQKRINNTAASCCGYLERRQDDDQVISRMTNNAIPRAMHVTPQYFSLIHILHYDNGITSDHVMASSSFPVNFEFTKIKVESYKSESNDRPCNLERTNIPNIQESLETKLIVPFQLRIGSTQGSLFETEKRKEVSLPCEIREEETDMILLYTDIHTLMNLTKDLLIIMSVI
ncbi:MAG TPA: hypothetical protein VH500_08570 [Nitrososphaeraceae archaeon]